jgi:single-strand DNA-binding protein
MSVNKVILIGNVGKNPEIKNLEGGVALASFPLATNETFKDKRTGEKKEQTEWHNIVMWRGLAESVHKSELKKGDQIYLEGKIRIRKWEDKEGNKKQNIEIVSDTFTILSRKIDRSETDATSKNNSEPVVSNY